MARTQSASPVEVRRSRARSTLPCSTSSLLFFATVTLMAGILSLPAGVQAKPPSRPSLIPLYVFVNFSSPDYYYTTAPGTNSSTTPGFGAISVFNTDLRLSASKEDAIVGDFSGQLDILRENNIYLDAVFTIDTPSYSGKISIQYKGLFLTTGEGPVTGGSGDFRYAVGYLEFVVGPQPDLENSIFQAIFHLKYFA